jgi:hypothetical protein
MANNTISAGTNPALANKIAAEAFSEQETAVEPAVITPPFNGTVELPGGYVTPAGEVIKTAVVRELNGKDEEAIGRVTSYSKIFPTLLTRAIVSVGNEKATEGLVDALLGGDRDALLLGIYRATFGDTAELGASCGGCKEIKTVSIDIPSDIPMKLLADPVTDRVFTVKGKKSEFLVTLPTGITQRLMVAAEDKNSAEITSILLENTVLEINGTPVVSPLQVQNLGLVDRRNIVEEIYRRNPGPKFEPITTSCPDCGGEVVVAISIGALFRF